MIYQVIIEKTICVEADNKDEAEDLAFFGDGFDEEERILSIRKK